MTSRNSAGQVNLAPMGPLFSADVNSLVLRPFQSSTTFRNLAETRCGVFHTTDDVLLLTRCALEEVPMSSIESIAATNIEGLVLADCGTWREFVIEHLDDSQPRSVLTARVVHCGHRRDLCGWNRAQFAVLEATILATRTHLMSAEDLQSQLTRLAPLVDKTAGPRELAAWHYVLGRIEELTTRSSTIQDALP